MITRKYTTGGLAIGLAALWLTACQAPQQAGSAGRAPHIVAQLPDGETVDAPEGPAPEIFPDTHVAAGRLHESQGRLARAAEQYRLAIGARPEHVEAHNRLGVVLDRLGKFSEADQAFGKAIQLAPKRAYLRNNLAFSYTMQGRWAEAEAQLNKAIELQPEFPRARVNLGMVLAQQSRFEAALEQFKRVLRPEDAYYNLGLMYQSKKLPVEAAQAFRQALAANPKMAAATKRMETLPPKAVSEAEQRGELFVTAMALTGLPAEETPAERPVCESPREAAEDSGETGWAGDVSTAEDEPVTADAEELTAGSIEEAQEFEPPGDMSVLEDLAAPQRDLVPMIVEDELVWDLIPQGDEEETTEDADEASHAAPPPWQHHLERLVERLRGPLERLLARRAPIVQEAAESASPLPTLVPEPLPADLLGPPAEALER